MITRMLVKDGYCVVTAANGAEGLRIAAEVAPDVITLDIMMPGMDGWAVLSKLKADPMLAAIPVIVATIIDDRNSSVSLGAAGYIIKPIDRKHLSEVVRRVRSTPGLKIVLIVEDDADARQLMRRCACSRRARYWTNLERSRRPDGRVPRRPGLTWKFRWLATRLHIFRESYAQCRIACR